MPGRSILLAVDLQKDFIDGALAVPGASAILPEIDAVKREFDLVYFTLDWHPSGHCSFKEQGGPWPVHCVHHTAGASLPDSVLEGLDEDRIRFILKGRSPEKEEYGAFSDGSAVASGLFCPEDTVVVCGIAAEYCVLETLRNVCALGRETGFEVRVFLGGTAKFDTMDPLLAFMSENGIKAW